MTSRRTRSSRASRDLRLRPARQLDQSLGRERAAQHGGVGDEGSQVRRQRVETGGQQRLQRLGHAQFAHVADEAVDAFDRTDDVAVDQHAHRLDRVERHALGLARDRRGGRLGQVRYESVQHRGHGDVVEWLQHEGRPAATGSPGRVLVGKLAAREGQDEDRGVPRPVDQVGEEVEQPVVGAVQVLDEHHHRLALSQLLEEHPPAREQIGLVHRRGLGGADAEEPAQPGRNELALRRVGHELGQPVDEALCGDVGGVLLGDPEPLAHHLGQRPERDPAAVGQAPTAMPEDAVDESVHVLLELPPKARLADARLPGDAHQPGRAPVDAGMEQVLDQPQLGVATDERRFQPVDPLVTADVADDTLCGPQLGGRGLALEHVLTRAGEGDRAARQPQRRVVGQHLARLRCRLHPRRGVDRVAGDHALADGVEVHRDLSRHDAGSRRQPGRADLGAQLRNGGYDVEGGAHRSLGVALGGEGRAPHRHHSVADELLDHAAVAGDDRAGRLEVARQQLADLLRVTRLRQRGEPDEIAEQHRTHAPFGARRGDGRGRDGSRGPSAGRQRRSAVPAEALVGRARGTTRRARRGQRRPALTTEFLAGRVLGLAGCTAHGGPPVRNPRSSSRSGVLGCRGVFKPEDLDRIRTHLHLADLARHGHRELVHDVDVARDLVVRELAARELAQLLGGE